MQASKIFKKRQGLIFIGFADALSAPEVAWSLIEAGYHVIAVARKSRYAALTSSRLVSVITIENPALDASASINEWKAALEKYSPAGVMPLDDASLWVVNQINNLHGAVIIGASGRQSEVALDKRLQIDAAMASGFAVPETVEVGGGLRFGDGIRYPVILKPALAAFCGQNRLQRGRFEKFQNEDNLTEGIDRIADAQPYLVQRLVNGVGEGVFGLASGGEVFHWSGHRRIRMMNPAGSGSSACISIEPSEEDRAAVTTLLRRIDWHGLFMVELLRDASGIAWFMELNGRPWGSMALARRRGLEYPAWAVACQLEGTTRFEARHPKNPEILCRHAGRELIHVAMTFRGNSRIDGNQELTRISAAKQVFSWSRKDVFYNWNSNDPAVFWADFAGTLGFGRITELVFRYSVLQLRKIRHRRLRWRLRRSAQKARKSPEMLDRVASASSILFVCYGNINRSAIAERLFGKKIGNACEITSCGFHDVVGREADPHMREVASQNGLSMDNWSSKRIDAGLVSEADVIFAMDCSHLVRLLELFPYSTEKIFLLGSACEHADIPLEIKDPFNCAMTEYQRCFYQIDLATSILTKIFDNRIEKK